MKMFFRFFIFSMFGMFSLSFSLYAETKRPLAPPSSVVLSLDDMILHFKIFVISDIFERISTPSFIENKYFFELTDLELDILMKNEIDQNNLLTSTPSLILFFKHQQLYIKIEETFFKCFQLEVLPEEFEYKIEPIMSSVFYEHFNNKNVKKSGT